MDRLHGEAVGLHAENARLHDTLKARTDQRDAALAHGADQCRQLVFVLAEARAERDAALKRASEDRVVAMRARSDIHGLIRERDGMADEIARLRDLLAQRPAPVPDTTKPAHDFTRVNGGDRRRLGGFQ